MSKRSNKKQSRGTAKKVKPAGKTAGKISARGAMAMVRNSQKSAKERISAMAHVTPLVCGDDKSLQTMLSILRDTNEPTPVRIRALEILAAAAFAVVEFESCRGDYLAALRAVVTDPELELRRRALGLLAREKDGFAIQKLLTGLQDPKDALVPPEKALQLLSYDLHAEAYPVARMIVTNPPNEAAKQEALRLLAADASSKPLFERLLRDKDETKEVRQISASALQSIAPESFQTHARAMLLDPKEYDDIQAASLTALTYFGDEAKVAKDDKLMERVGSMKKAESSKLKQGARAFFAKYNA